MEGFCLGFSLSFKFGISKFNKTAPPASIPIPVPIRATPTPVKLPKEIAVTKIPASIAKAPPIAIPLPVPSGVPPGCTAI